MMENTGITACHRRSCDSFPEGAATIHSISAREPAGLEGEANWLGADPARSELRVFQIVPAGFRHGIAFFVAGDLVRHDIAQLEAEIVRELE